VRLEEGKTGAIEEGEFVVAPFDKDDDDDDDHLNGPPALSVVANHLPRREEDSSPPTAPRAFLSRPRPKRKNPKTHDMVKRQPQSRVSQAVLLRRR